MTATTARVRRVPIIIPAAIAGAWLVCVVAQVTGKSRLLHHDAVFEGRLPYWAALVLFVVAWQLMTAAMMLPSSLPMVRLFGRASANQDNPAEVMAAFLGGYALVWSVFGAVAFASDLVLHRLVDRTPWLAEHEWVISGTILAVAGAFQFSSLKDKCLNTCRAPAIYLMRRYRRGVGPAFRLGRSHGLFCLGCCWALMLVMFAAGVANLWWMALLAAVMVYEKVGRRGRRLTPVIGVAFLAWGALVLAHPSFLPAALAGV